MYFFLDRESVDQLPYILACLLCYFPTELHADIMQLLCDCILPYTLQGAIASFSAKLKLIFRGMWRLVCHLLHPRCAHARFPVHQGTELECATFCNLLRVVFRSPHVAVGDADVTSTGRVSSEYLLSKHCESVPVEDVLAVIAKGTSEARVPAANLLFHYWPLLNPHILDRKPIQYRPHGW
jgi:hypothetical protein